MPSPMAKSIFILIYIFSAGGVYLSALEDRILCDNTLETRLHLVFDAALPKIRASLFTGEEIL